jgi:hypothetical protein
VNVTGLRDLLRRKPVPEDAYAIDSDTRIDAYILARDGRTRSVYYSERGLRTDKRAFAT